LVSTMDFSNVAFEVEVSVVANVVTRSRVVGLERELETERKGNVLWLGSRTEEYGGKNDSTFAISVHMTTKSVRDDVIVRKSRRVLLHNTLVRDDLRAPSTRSSFQITQTKGRI
jgi:hypothetical protein